MRYTARQLKTAARNKQTEHLVCSQPGWLEKSAEIDPLVFSRLMTRKEYIERFTPEWPDELLRQQVRNGYV